jgi:hypothetical protein
MKPYLLIVLCLMLASCASYHKNIKHIKHHPDEIVAFRQYMEDTYGLDKFDKYETIWGKWGEQPDSLIRQFCIKNNIASIAKIPASTNDPDSYAKYGNIVLLYFAGSILEPNECIVFDYTEKGLGAYIERALKYEIADRVYIFYESEFLRTLRKTFNPTEQDKQDKLENGPYVIENRQ